MGNSENNINNVATANDNSIGGIVGGAVGGVVVLVVAVVVVILFLKKKKQNSQKGKSQIKPWSADEDYNNVGATTFEGPEHRDQGKIQGPNHQKYEAKGPKKRMSAHLEAVSRVTL